jgi:hypothetical protein
VIIPPVTLTDWPVMYEAASALMAQGPSSSFSVTFETISSHALSVFDAARIPSISFEHLTYSGSEIEGTIGIEPREEDH